MEAVKLAGTTGQHRGFAEMSVVDGCLCGQWEIGAGLTGDTRRGVIEL